MAQPNSPLALVTGASTGIGYELAKCCAHHGFDLMVVAEESRIHQAAEELSEIGVAVTAVQADLATPEGVMQLIDALGGRPVDALLANAGRGLGKSFFEQDWEDIRYVIDTNVVGTTKLLHHVGRGMLQQNHGRILITGSVAGILPGAFQAVYNGTKAFLDNFAFGLRAELADSAITVTCLMPGPTESAFFERADLTDTRVGEMKKDDTAKVAKEGFDAMMAGKADVVTGWQNKLQVAIGRLLPGQLVAKAHGKMMEPGSARRPG